MMFSLCLSFQPYEILKYLLTVRRLTEAVRFMLPPYLTVSEIKELLAQVDESCTNGLKSSANAFFRVGFVMELEIMALRVVLKQYSICYVRYLQC
jgi:mannose/fructose/N-acetylgalactosamine-specific phosphotransferase system component IIC